ncbi:MAG: hypothetical protein HY000_09710 [Planctomycetes bacterium]|nr:hypothetical protein [Planctomycetota bacterium]
MRFYKLQPEVAGGWGPNTVFTRGPGGDVVIHKFHYQFDGWLGDELLESTPCFIVTRRLADELQKSALSGYELKAVEVSTSDQFQDLYADCQLPEFLWLDVTGTAGVNDFGTDELMLVVSENALTALKKAHLENCDIQEFA